MPSVQLSFTLRTTPTVRSLHLVGSWDNYASQLPMSQDPSKKKSSGAWVGTFKFQSGSLQPGSRYWYYYIMDGYHVTHDPARECIVEPTTQRKLNIIDIPASSSKPRSMSSSRQSKRTSRRMSVEVPKGRALSPSKIVSPRPQRPGQTSSIANETYNKASLREITERMGRAQLDSEDDSEDDDSDSDSDDDSDVPSLTSRSSNSSSPSSVSSASSTDSCCTCERYGITRAGNRVKLDCGGDVCGSSEDDCSSDDDVRARQVRSSRRQGVVGIRR